LKEHKKVHTYRFLCSSTLNNIQRTYQSRKQRTRERAGLCPKQKRSKSYEDNPPEFDIFKLISKRKSPLVKDHIRKEMGSRSKKSKKAATQSVPPANAAASGVATATGAAGSFISQAVNGELPVFDLSREPLIFESEVLQTNDRSKSFKYGDPQRTFATELPSIPYNGGSKETKGLLFLREEPILNEQSLSPTVLLGRLEVEGAVGVLVIAGTNSRGMFNDDFEEKFDTFTSIAFGNDAQKQQRDGLNRLHNAMIVAGEMETTSAAFYALPDNQEYTFMPGTTELESLVVPNHPCKLLCDMKCNVPLLCDICIPPPLLIISISLFCTLPFFYIR